MATRGSDYINASYIDVRLYRSIILLATSLKLPSIQGYKQRKAYIATQGPLESTVCDFWRMVWENESKCIVLLSNLKENGEVQQTSLQ